MDEGERTRYSQRRRAWCQRYWKRLPQRMLSSPPEDLALVAAWNRHSRLYDILELRVGDLLDSVVDSGRRVVRPDRIGRLPIIISTMLWERTIIGVFERLSDSYGDVVDLALEETPVFVSDGRPRTIERIYDDFVARCDA